MWPIHDAGPPPRIASRNGRPNRSRTLAIGRLGAWPVLATARLADGEIDAIAAHCDPRLALYVPRNSASAADHAARRLARMTDLAPLGAIGIERFAGERAPDPSPADVA